MTEKKNVSQIQRRLIPSYIFLTIVSFISVFPFYWMISAATNKSIDVARGRIVFGSSAVENFKTMVNQQDLWGAMANSFKYAIVQTIIALFICSLAGFGFELYHDKYKDKLFSILLLAFINSGAPVRAPHLVLVGYTNTAFSKQQIKVLCGK